MTAGFNPESPRRRGTRTCAAHCGTQSKRGVRLRSARAQSLRQPTQRKPKKLLAELTKALPQSNCQKNGFTADDMRGMLDSVQATGGQQCAMWTALFQLAWFGVLRPGECVPAGAFDASKHPSRSNIRFYRQGQRVHPGVNSDVMPTPCGGICARQLLLLLQRRSSRCAWPL